MVKEKATKMANEAGLANFKASNGWFMYYEELIDVPLQSQEESRVVLKLKKVGSAWRRTLIYRKSVMFSRKAYGGLSPRMLNPISDEMLANEHFSRKVFVGGLPIDINEAEIVKTFSKFGRVLVDWPRRSNSHKDHQSNRSMTGYVFLVYEDERAVKKLISECYADDDRFYLLVSSPTMRKKPVQVRPWKLADMDYILKPKLFLDPRRTIFIGGVPRPTHAAELAHLFECLFGTVCYASIDIDPELKYPKGAARVTFCSSRSFIAAITGRFVLLPHGETKKRVEVKPYVMDDQICDNCYGKNCADRWAPYFCGDPSCLQYYCEACWDQVHYGNLLFKKRNTHKVYVRYGDQTKCLPQPPHHNDNTNSGCCIGTITAKANALPIGNLKIHQ